jgi:hypothetical protein
MVALRAIRPWTVLSGSDASLNVLSPPSLRREKPSRDMPTPHADEARPFHGFRSPLLHLDRRMAIQMLMRPRMVVNGAKLHQLYPQIIAIHDGGTIQRVLERTKEPFDPAVLPRAVQVGGLQSDAQHAKRHFHQPRVETRFIVHAKGARQAEASKAGQQAPQIYKYPTDSIYQIPPPDYASVGGNALGGSAGVAVNLHNGQMYGSGGGSVPVEAGAGFVFGWILNGGSDALDPGKTTNNFLSGAGASGAGCYFICAGLNHSFGGATAIEIGGLGCEK